MPSQPELSVVLCSLNGAAGVDRCLHLLARQTRADGLETIVVDDGSTDDTTLVGQTHGATVVRHESNRGLAAARNSGVGVATGSIVAFLDDDCEPEETWAEHLLAAFADPAVVAVGGAILAPEQPGFMGRFLTRNNPLRPLDAELAHASNLPQRFALYLRRQWEEPREDRRPVHALVGANMAFRGPALSAAGLFDERFRFGSEELDLCVRLRAAVPDGRLLHEPDARIAHSFRPSLRDTLRRSRAYGRGSARMFRKWPQHAATVFPFPIVLGGVVMAGRTRGVGVALVLAQAMFPSGARYAMTHRRPEALLDAYVRILQEAAENVGFAQGLWRFRNLSAMPAPDHVAEDAPPLPKPVLA